MSEMLTIEDLLAELNVPHHVVNLWIKKFPILNPQRGQDGKLIFKNRDLAFAKGLKHLLQDDKNTIRDVQTILNERGIAHIIDLGKKDNTKGITLNSQKQNSTKTVFDSKFSINHREIAKKTFENMNKIFSKTNKEHNNLNTNIPDNSSISLVTTTEPQIITPELKVDDANSFEDNWRHIMEKAGKATPIEQVRDKPDTYPNNDFLTDIWEIDDEIELFDVEPITLSPSMPSSTIKPPSEPLKLHSNASYHAKGLTIEQTEKISHLIAKLDIMRDEMISANSLITKTLKSFGYSSIDSKDSEIETK